jgi:hypothetical protein
MTGTDPRRAPPKRSLASPQPPGPLAPYGDQCDGAGRDGREAVLAVSVDDSSFSTSICASRT